MRGLRTLLLPLAAWAALNGSSAGAQVVAAPRDMVTIVVLKSGVSIDGVVLSDDALDKRLADLAARKTKPPMDVVSPANDADFEAVQAIRSRVVKHGLKLVAKVGFVTKP